MLAGKKILLGITGSIAAYKSATLVRFLLKKGADVQVVMTSSATNFIPPLTLSTLSKRPVFVDYFDAKNGQWNNHVELALWADLMIIAPLTANSLSKMANGSCDNLLMACYLSAKAPVFVAPAMDLDMWQHPATQCNVTKIATYGNTIIIPKNGELASGLYGVGRMQEPEEIVQYLEHYFTNKKCFSGKKVLITAGPTYEKLDPVRFIGNFSTGKMGFALAESMAMMGAEVVLITGPTTLEIENPNIKVIRVISASEMFNECLKYFENCTIAIYAAAVADYTPSETSATKIKKKEESLTIQLTKTKDILGHFGEIKQKNQFLVGFALETNNELENAISKLEKKNLDFVVLNSLNDKGSGFAFDTNKITIIDKHKNIFNYETKSKKLVAEDICLKIKGMLS